jgi:hypothetical protein
MNKISTWFKALSRKGKVATIVGASLLGMTAVGAASPQPQTTQPSPPITTTKTQSKTPKIEKKPVEEKTVIAFTTINKEDATLTKGTTKITQEGVNGERTITYEVTYKDGIETGREKVSDEITKPAVDKTITVGTYVAPVYTPAPSTTSTNPSSGARTGAVCEDGSSSAATGRGACSHHGGVAYWTY